MALDDLAARARIATADPAGRLRDEERDAAVLAGRLPIQLFDIERSTENSPRSPFYPRGF